MQPATALLLVLAASEIRMHCANAAEPGPCKEKCYRLCKTQCFGYKDAELKHTQQQHTTTPCESLHKKVNSSLACHDRKRIGGGQEWNMNFALGLKNICSRRGRSVDGQPM